MLPTSASATPQYDDAALHIADSSSSDDGEDPLASTSTYAADPFKKLQHVKRHRGPMGLATPTWASTPALAKQLQAQDDVDPDTIFGSDVPPLDLEGNI